MAGEPGAPGLILLQRGGSTNSRERFSNRGRALHSDNTKRIGRTRVMPEIELRPRCLPSYF